MLKGIEDANQNDLNKFDKNNCYPAGTESD